jgi:microcystin-dependent protein
VSGVSFIKMNLIYPNIGQGLIYNNGDIEVNPDLDFLNSVKINNSLEVTGDSSLNGKLTVNNNGTLTVTGATTLSDTLTVSGATTMNNSLNINTNYGSTLNPSVAITDTVSGQNLYIVPNIVTGNWNPASVTGNISIIAKGSEEGQGVLELTCWSGNKSIIVISNDEVFLEYNDSTITLDSSGTTIDSSLKVSGATTASSFVGNGVTPIGGIIMWSGDINNNSPKDTNGVIHTNWKICDGTNNTPDLKGRFIVGQNPSDDSFSTIKNTGGEKEVTLTVDQMPKHTHTINDGGSHLHEVNNIGNDKSAIYAYLANNNGTGNADLGGGDKGNEQFDIATNDWSDHRVSSGAHSHTIENNGGSNAHNNLPPYYVLAYIMRIS